MEMALWKGLEPVSAAEGGSSNLFERFMDTQLYNRIYIYTKNAESSFFV